MDKERRWKRGRERERCRGDDDGEAVKGRARKADEDENGKCIRK